MSGDLLVRNVRPMAGAAVDVLATGGVIARVGSGIAAAPGVEVVDGQHGILMPGFVDARTCISTRRSGACRGAPTTLGPRC